MNATYPAPAGMTNFNSLIPLISTKCISFATYQKQSDLDFTVSFSHQACPIETVYKKIK